MVFDERLQSLCIILYLFSFFWGFDLKKKAKSQKRNGWDGKTFQVMFSCKGLDMGVGGGEVLLTSIKCWRGGGGEWGGLLCDSCCEILTIGETVDRCLECLFVFHYFYTGDDLNMSFLRSPWFGS